jgi:hypothetical protein
MTPEENGPSVPELARRATVSSCRHDPVRALAPVLTALPGQGIPLGDILADSGYSHRPGRRTALTGTATTTSPAPATTTTATTRRKHALTQRKPGNQAQSRHPKTPAPDHELPRGQNVRPKRENRPHRNVKTSRWS